MELSLDLNVVCRICLCDGDMRSLDTEVNGYSYKEKILQCTNIQLNFHANFPEQICNKCVEDLETAYLFRLNCESSDAILLSFVENQAKEAERLRLEAADGDGDSDVDIDLVPQQQHDDEIEYLTYTDMVSEEYLNEHELAQLTDTVDHHIELTSEPPSVADTNDDERQQYGEIQESKETSNVVVVIGLPKAKDKSTESRRRPKPQVGTDTDQNVCELCGKSYLYKHRLEIHMRRHQGIKPYKCNECELSFVIPFELKRHQRTHNGDKPYGCKHCDRKFSDFGSRKKHERTHTGERPYQCGQCPKSFTYSHVLASHKLVHSGEKNFVCPICQKRFAKAHHLKSHRNVHLKEQLTANIEDKTDDNLVTDDQQSSPRYIEIFESGDASHQILVQSPKSFMLEQKFFPKTGQH